MDAEKALAAALHENVGAQHWMRHEQGYDGDDIEVIECEGGPDAHVEDAKDILAALPPGWCGHDDLILSAMDAEKVLAEALHELDPHGSFWDHVHPDPDGRAVLLKNAGLAARLAAALPPCGHEAEIARLRKIEEALDRDEEQWLRAIVEWLGPQRMSIEQPRAERGYARGALIAAAILRAALDEGDER